MPDFKKKDVDLDRLKVFIVDNQNDLMRVFALRSVVYMGGQVCPFNEEFDGNDIAGATHVLATYKGEPVGTYRLRWFGDFAKVERACVSPNYRANKIMFAMTSYGRKMIAQKGYSYVIIHAQKRLAEYWELHGFKVRDGRPSFFFSDYEYIEMGMDLSTNEAVIHKDMSPMILNRKEGEWHKESVLEQSAIRGANA